MKKNHWMMLGIVLSILGTASFQAGATEQKDRAHQDSLSAGPKTFEILLKSPLALEAFLANLSSPSVTIHLFPVNVSDSTSTSSTTTSSSSSLPPSLPSSSDSTSTSSTTTSSSSSLPPSLPSSSDSTSTSSTTTTTSSSSSLPPSLPSSSDSSTSSTTTTTSSISTTTPSTSSTAMSSSSSGLIFSPDFTPPPSKLIEVIYQYRRLYKKDGFFNPNRETPNSISLFNVPNPFLSNMCLQNWQEVTAYAFPMIRIYSDEIQQYLNIYAANPTGIAPVADIARDCFQKIRMLSYILRTSLAYGYEFARTPEKQAEERRLATEQVTRECKQEKQKRDTAIKDSWESKKQKVQNEIQGILDFYSIQLDGDGANNLYLNPNSDYTSSWRSQPVVDEIIGKIKAIQPATNLGTPPAQMKIQADTHKETQGKFLNTLQKTHPGLWTTHLAEVNRLCTAYANYERSQNAGLAQLRKKHGETLGQFQYAFQTTFAEFTAWGAVSSTGVRKDCRSTEFQAFPVPDRDAIALAEEEYQIGFLRHVKRLPSNSTKVPHSQQDSDFAWLGHYLSNLKIPLPNLPHPDFLRMLGIKEITEKVKDGVLGVAEDD